MNVFICLLSFLLVVPVQNSLCADTRSLSANEVMHKAYLAGYYPAQDQTSEVTFTLLDNTTKPKEVKFHLYRMKTEGVYKTFIGLDQPLNLAGKSLMVWEKPYGLGDLWIYDPVLGHALYLDSFQKQNHFIGSIFTYADISSRALNEDHCQFLNNQSVVDHYLLKCVPKNASKLDFQYYTALIRKDNFIPIRFEYIGDHGQLVKFIEVQYIKEIQGYPTVMQILGKELKTQQETHIKFDRVQYNLGLSDSLFTVEYMQHYRQKQ